MFQESQTRPLLGELCRQIGRSETDAVLIRHHTNGVYSIGDVVAKIAPPGTDSAALHTVVAMVNWLAGQDFPTVTLTKGIAQPLNVDGYLATIWEHLDATPEAAVTPDELGDLLRRLHNLPTPPFLLPHHAPIPEIRRSIATSTILREADRRLLHDHLQNLGDAWTTMRFPLPTGVIHVDPQPRNALRRPDGEPVLADWDSISIGHPEWDVATIAVHSRRFSRTGHDTFNEFVKSYRWDPATWSRFEDLCRLRELKMIATNARKSHSNTPAADEVHRRITALRDGDETLDWNIL